MLSLREKERIIIIEKLTEVFFNLICRGTLHATFGYMVALCESSQVDHVVESEQKKTRLWKPTKFMFKTQQNASHEFLQKL